jgi:hypothetical protein
MNYSDTLKVTLQGPNLCLYIHISTIFCRPHLFKPGKLKNITTVDINFPFLTSRSKGGRHLITTLKFSLKFSLI